MAVAQVTSRLDDLERERNSLRDDLTNMKAQRMRNNRICTGEPEAENESHETTEKILRKHLNDALTLGQETADAFRFERVHRSPGEHMWKGSLHHSEVYLFAMTRKRCDASGNI